MRFHFHGRTCPRGRRACLGGGSKDFEISRLLPLSLRLVVFRNEIIKRATFPRGTELDGGRKRDYFHSLNYTLPSSHVNREAGRQAGTHACTHAGLFIQLRARAFDSRPFPYHRVPTDPTDCLDFELNTKQISFGDTRPRIDTRLLAHLLACVRSGDAK